MEQARIGKGSPTICPELPINFVGTAWVGDSILLEIDPRDIDLGVELPPPPPSPQLGIDRSTSGTYVVQSDCCI